MNRCMEWGNALKHLGLPWGGAGLTTQAPESWESGVMGEGGWVGGQLRKKHPLSGFSGDVKQLVRFNQCVHVGGVQLYNHFTTTTH